MCRVPFFNSYASQWETLVYNTAFICRETVRILKAAYNFLAVDEVPHREGSTYQVLISVHLLPFRVASRSWDLPREFSRYLHRVGYVEPERIEFFIWRWEENPAG